MDLIQIDFTVLKHLISEIIFAFIKQDLFMFQYLWFIFFYMDARTRQVFNLDGLIEN